MLSAKERRYRTYVILAGLVTFTVSLALFLFLRRHETAVDDCACQVIKQEIVGYQFYIDDVHIDQDDLQLSGWILKEGIEQKFIERHLVLKNKSSQEFLKLATEIVRRPDLTALRNDGINYTYGGFFATVALEELDLEKNDYAVYVLDESDDDQQMVEIVQSLREEIKDAQTTENSSE